MNEPTTDETFDPEKTIETDRPAWEVAYDYEDIT